ncbi:hypothetical protein CDL15_Pgr024756 [Punica granatum]|uniref:Uncharacterized protein n=1 Tax=Punica granatum TaxID=22663 RepID=A0A218W613_PUNGR|nr:hypothetical protein CDL15_Pgr024756 [Punica granatum]
MRLVRCCLLQPQGRLWVATSCSRVTCANETTTTCRQETICRGPVWSRAKDLTKLSAYGRAKAAANRSMLKRFKRKVKILTKLKERTGTPQLPPSQDGKIEKPEREGSGTRAAGRNSSR